MLLSPSLFPLFAYSNVLTSWKNNTNVEEFSNIYCVKKGSNSEQEKKEPLG